MSSREEKLAVLAAELEAVKIAPKPTASEGIKERPNTVSSGTPLRYRDLKIPPKKIERFLQLDLDLLLSEFKAVAASKEEKSREEEDDDDKKATAEGDEESRWLATVGLKNLTDKFNSGTQITDEDIVKETAGYTDDHVRVIKQRVQTLNATLKKQTGKERKDARDLFGQAKGDPSEPIKIPDAATMPPTPIHFQDLATVELGEKTYFDDLGEEDKENLRSLSLIEFTSFMDLRLPKSGLKLAPKNKKKKKKKQDGVFGVDLETLLERDRAMHGAKLEHPCVPLFLSRALTYLLNEGINEEGIFRKTGSSARIKALRQKCEDNKGDIVFLEADAFAHDVAALLKQFLREIPEPLLTDDYIEAFYCTQQLDDPREQFYALQLLVSVLPETNRICLKYLLSFLNRVAASEDKNKMSLSNLAVVFAPTLFYVSGQKGQKMLKEVEMQVSTASTLKLLIEFANDLWEVQPNMLMQLRHVNEARRAGKKLSTTKEVKRLLSKKVDKEKEKVISTKREDDELSNSPSVQWVAASNEQPPVRAVVSVVMLDGSEKDMKVTDSTTAEQVLKFFGAKDTDYLSEIGGNIGSRRLSPKTLLITVLQHNPQLALSITSQKRPSLTP